ncbi:DUF6949 family protein [Faunimonas sp. B44]|uniref:DUF6949 family protein n=1 Tax=Faunimonas sp. B44 TaxID=3461493 RepID=UPI004043DAB5
MSEFAIFGFCAAMGFALAGVVATFYQLVTSEVASFRVGRTTFIGNAMAVILSMFGGPFIVARTVVAGFRARELPGLLLLIGLAISAIWSTCAGIFVVSLLVHA